MPKGLNEEEIREAAKALQDASRSLIIIQLGSQVVLKGTIKHLVHMYFALQLLKAIPIYSIDIPAETMIYIEVLQSFIDFKMLDPNYLMGLVIEDFDLKDYLGA